MKSIKYGVFTFFIFLLAMVFPVFAELYQYIDKKGFLIFTDDFSRVPVVQRERLKIINEIKSERGDNTETVQPLTSSPDETNVLSGRLMQEEKALIKENSGLKQEYELIIEGNKKLSILRKTLEGKKISKSELDAFNGQVSEMNLRSQQYDDHLQSYRDHVNAYNMRIEQLKKIVEGKNGG